MIRSLILSTAAVSLAALAQDCIASAKPSHLAIAPHLFLGGLVLFILAFAKPLRGERRTIWWKALPTLMGLVLAFVAYLTHGEHFLLAVAFSLLSVVLLGGAFGQEDESGRKGAREQWSKGAGGEAATERLLLLAASLTALLALFAWWRELDPDGALAACRRGCAPRLRKS